MTNERRLEFLGGFANILGIHPNELMAIKSMGDDIYNALVPNRDVVDDLRRQWGSRLKLLDQGSLFLVSIDLKPETTEVVA